jgi:methylmalonyl-CoA carboxyltransferase 5S subunit
MLLRGQNLLGYRHYEDTVVDRFVEKSAENGMDVFRVFDALNDVRNLRRALDAVRRTGKHAQGTICYTTSPMHTDEKFVEMAQRLKDMGVDSICIKDMAALLRPRPAFDIVRGIKEKCGADTTVHVHVHSTTGVTMVSLMKAIEAGADIVDTSISSLSLGPGHNPTEALVEMLAGTEYTTRLKKDRLKKIKDHFAKVRPRYAGFESKFIGVETEIFDSQIPGGMISNMESQLKQQGAGDRVDDVLAEVPRVRKAAGYPPLVTPSSQIVGTQAVFNVLMGPYKALTAEFADLMLGYYGETIAPRAEEIAHAAAKHAKKEPIACRPADLLKPEWQELRTAAMALKGCNGTDEDILTYAMFPQVAPKFFAQRAEGPKNVSKTAAAAADAAKPVDAAAKPEGGKGPITSPVTYEIRVGENSHRVSVQPA